MKLHIRKGWFTNTARTKSADLILDTLNVSAKSKKGLVAGCGLIVLGTGVVIASAFRGGSEAFEFGEFDALKSLDLIK